MKNSFGLDLAGYSTGRSTLAMAYKDKKEIHVDILNGHQFEKKFEGKNKLDNMTKGELACIQCLLQKGNLYIDIPIDLQGLPHPSKPQYIWELRKRPIDEHLDGLPPLADKIGSPVARMQNIWSLLRKQSGEDPLAESIFETYPAASLSKSEHDSEGYKGTAEYSDSTWKGKLSSKGDEKKENVKLADILNNLSWTADEGFPLNHDEFDAAICALTGLGKQLKGNALQKEMNDKLEGNYSLPRGYVLLKEIPKNVILDRRNYQSRLASE
ncbi:MAG: hypothetical protein HQK86_15225 [Nitrospinae bacterium]|nr:hypothetical protein [Nitrospinota bacterium]